MFTVFCEDNYIDFFIGRGDVKRCDVCLQLIDKWNKDLNISSIPKKLKYDFSVSMDGVFVVSDRFFLVLKSTLMRRK